MKLKIIGSVLALTCFIFSYFFILDDQLHADIPEILQQHNQTDTSALNGSVYQLGMWAEISDDPMTIGLWRLKQYQQAIEKNNGVNNEITYDDYPDDLMIIEIFTDDDTPTHMCDTEDFDCLSYIYEHTDAIPSMVEEQSLYIERYDNLMAFNHFTAYLPATFNAPQPGFGPSAEVLQLKLLDIIYHFKQGKIADVVSQLTELVLFHKKVLAQTPYMPPKIASIIELEMILDTSAFLISKTNDLAQWQPFIDSLTALSIEQITFQKPFFHEFVTLVNTLENIDIHEYNNELPELADLLPANVLFKKNKTINMLYRWIQNNIGIMAFDNNNNIVEVDKEKSEDILAFDYQNPIGSTIAASMAPKLLNLEGYLFQVAVKQSMLRTQFQTTSSGSNEQTLISPYTQEPSYIHGPYVCLSVDDDVNNDICITAL